MSIESSKINGICFIVGSTIIALALVYHARTNRYHFQKDTYPAHTVWIFDSWTGNVTTDTQMSLQRAVDSGK